MNGRIVRILGPFSVVPVLLVTFAVAAEASVVVSRAEVSGSRLRLEGQASPNRGITVDGVQMTTSGSTGSFKIDRSGYTAPGDCTVDVNDGSAAAADVRLSGCAVSTPPPSPSPSPPPPPPATTVTIDSVTLSPASLQGGGTAAGTVTLTGVAPPGGALVALSSSNTAAVTVPPTVTVPEGVNSWPAFVSTSPVTATTTSIVSATYNGVTRSATMTVTPPPVQPPAALDSITLSPSTVQTGTSRSGATIALTGPAPDGGATIALASSNPAVATVTVPALSSTGAFDVTALPTAGTSTISATYLGVTRSAVLTVTAQTLFRITTPAVLPNATVGQNYAGFIEACCGQGTPYSWSLVSGTVPAGLRFAGNSLRLVQTTAVTGVATRVETTTFTVRARDQAGNTATKTFTLSVDPALPLVITNQTDRLPDGHVGVTYAVGLFPGGGVPPYRWSLVGGTLPPGLSVQASPGRVLGTPTTAGTFTFTVRVDDSGGQFATGQFTIVVLP